MTTTNNTKFPNQKGNYGKNNNSGHHTFRNLLMIIVVLFFINEFMPGSISGLLNHIIPSKEDVIQKGLEQVLEEDSENRTQQEELSIVRDYLLEAADHNLKDSMGNTIVQESVETDEAALQCTYVDSGNVLHVVDLSDDYGGYINSGAESGTAADTAQPFFDSLSSFADRFGLGAVDVKAAQKESIMLFGIDAPGANWHSKHKEFVNSLKQQGLNIDMIDQATVADYKTALTGKQMIYIETHGGVITNGYRGLINCPFLAVAEEATPQKQKKYGNDLSSMSTYMFVFETVKDGKVIKEFGLLPPFFTQCYSPLSMAGTYVHMGNCLGYGNTHEYGISTALADAFFNCGAAAVTVYENSVYTAYDLEMCKSIFSSLANGMPLQEAVVNAQNTVAPDDYTFGSAVWGADSEIVQKKLNEKGIAVMHCIAPNNWILSDGLEETPEETPEPAVTPAADNSAALLEELRNTWNPNDYPDYKYYVNRNCYPENNGILVDLTHDGYPELVVAEYPKGSDSSIHMNLYVIAIGDGGVPMPIYSRTIGTAHVDSQDLFLTKADGSWYLTLLYDAVYGGVKEQHFETFYLDSLGSVQYLFQSETLIYEELNDSDKDLMSRYYNYTNTLNSYLSQSILAAGSNTRQGSALPRLDELFAFDIAQPATEPDVPSADVPETVTWTITKRNTGMFEEYREMTYQLEWTTNEEHSVVSQWDPNEVPDIRMVIIDYSVDMKAHTIDMTIDYPEGIDYRYHYIVINQMTGECCLKE